MRTAPIFDDPPGSAPPRGRGCRLETIGGSVNGRDAPMRATIAAVMLCLFLLTSCSSDVAGNTASPAGASSPTSSDVRILDDCPQLPCGEPLEPARYRWAYSEPMVDFEIDSRGWSWLFGGGGLHLIATEDPLSTNEGLFVPDGIYFFRDPTIASRDCEESSEPGVGHSVNDLVGWLEAASGLTVSEPTPVTIGGLQGMQLDLEIDPAWERTCFFSEGLPAVPLIFNGAETGGYHWAIVPDQSLRWFVLESEDGVLIVNLEDDPGGLSREDLLRTGTRIVESFEFDA
jgi:hypothetical protein